MPKDIKTPFKDYIVPKPEFTVKPTLGSTPGQPQGGSADAGVSGTVKPKELPKNSLWHGK